MRLSICTDVMGDNCAALGVEGVEMTGGGWSRGPHCRADRLLADKGALKAAPKEIEARGFGIAALNCSANPLDPGPMGARHAREMEDTVRLAGEIGVKTVVAISGLPAAAPGESVPNRLVYTRSWEKMVRLAVEVGVEKYALENFSAMLVWNPETLFRLRDAVGPKIGMNLDPSHLMWMGADPIASARALGTAIHHCHGKDTRIERGLADVNGLLEPRDVTDVANRAWNYVAVGAGHDLQWWKEFFSVVRMVGYDDWVSLEYGGLHHVDRGLREVFHRRLAGHDQLLRPAGGCRVRALPGNRRCRPRSPSPARPAAGASTTSRTPTCRRGSACSTRRRPRNVGGVLADLAASRTFLRDIGFHQDIV